MVAVVAHLEARRRLAVRTTCSVVRVLLGRVAWHARALRVVAAAETVLANGAVFGARAARVGARDVEADVIDAPGRRGSRRRIGRRLSWSFRRCHGRRRRGAHARVARALPWLRALFAAVHGQRVHIEGLDLNTAAAALCAGSPGKRAKATVDRTRGIIAILWIFEDVQARPTMPRMDDDTARARHHTATA